MRTVHFVTHPQVVVDAGRPVERWHLSDEGIRRMRLLAVQAEAFGLRSVWASAETKAIEAAGILAGRLGLPVQVRPALGENDRSATGFLPPAEFERVADAFFARPTESVRGWERACDAQDRIATAVEAVLAEAPEGPLAIVAHGAVGTLLLCRLLGQPITRERDQPFQGHHFAYTPADGQVLHGWRDIAPKD